MPENRQFIDLTEVFYQSTRVSEDPHTLWNRFRAATSPLCYDYNAVYEQVPATKQIAIPVDSILKIEECDYSGGVKAALTMKTGGTTIYTQDDKTTILAKIAPAPKLAK